MPLNNSSPSALSGFTATTGDRTRARRPSAGRLLTWRGVRKADASALLCCRNPTAYVDGLLRFPRSDTCKINPSLQLQLRLKSRFPPILSFTGVVNRYRSRQRKEPARPTCPQNFTHNIAIWVDTTVGFTNPWKIISLMPKDKLNACINKRLKSIYHSVVGARVRLLKLQQSNSPHLFICHKMNETNQK